MKGGLCAKKKIICYGLGIHTSKYLSGITDVKNHLAALKKMQD